MSGRAARPRSLLRRRSAAVIDVILFVAALLTIAVVVNLFARRPALRVTLDSTRTRAYSLSPQTRRILQRLDGSWTIALVMVESATSRSVRQQVEEVLRRYRQASPAISVVRVDPARPESLGRYEALLARLRSLEPAAIAAYDGALDEGTRLFRALRIFAAQQAGQLEVVLGRLGPEDPRREEIQQGLGLLSVVAREGDELLEAVVKARALSAGQPIPDYETARSILAQALSRWGDELYGMARRYEGWAADASAPPALVHFSAGVAGEYRKTARRLAQAAEPLRALPPLQLSAVGRALTAGEAAVIIGPERAAVIPSAQLFPKLNVREVSDGAVAFDQRFRGEQVISAAIRSLLVPQMPMVVFVHGGERSLLRGQDHRADLVGVAGLLRASRFAVREWAVQSGDRPRPAAGQPVVWIVVPPTQRRGLEPEPNEPALLRATERLIAGGEAVMLNVYPSLLPRYRQDDPWQRLAAPFNLRPDTARPIMEAVPRPDGSLAVQNGQAIRSFTGANPICAAVHGQQAYFPLPCAVRTLDPKRSEVHVDVVARVEASSRRWLAEDWPARLSATAAAEPGGGLPAAAPIVVAAERRRPQHAGRQRFLLVGSGGWLLSNVADAVRAIGGDRVALVNPGNQELMLAAVSWLAGMDDLIAPGPVSRQVARLEGIDRGVALRWGLLAILGVPAGCVLLGGVVWLVRRA